uniref:(California timema) hypothetical protein n=1 Tax=Timema californicum TaxID=61474 RepID=A0A7R9J496_TIMCA|nr:unnamed protein product [Timema californicum]
MANSYLDGLKYSTTVSSKGSKSTTTVVRNVELDAANVPGLSSAVVSIPNGEVGPGAAKQGQYKNPEYFCYNPISYFEAEIEMAKYRIPQPSSNQKYCFQPVAQPQPQVRLTVTDGESQAGLASVQEPIHLSQGLGVIPWSNTGLCFRSGPSSFFLDLFRRLSPSSEWFMSPVFSRVPLIGGLKNHNPLKGFGTSIITLAKDHKCQQFGTSEEDEALVRQWVEYTACYVNYSDIRTTAIQVLKNANALTTELSRNRLVPGIIHHSYLKAESGMDVRKLAATNLGFIKIMKVAALSDNL